MSVRFHFEEPCENVSEGLDCGVYLGYLAVYGRALSDATSNFVFKSIASTINNAVLSRVSKFGIVHVSDLEKFSTQVDEGTNQQLEDSASSITSDKPLSVGAKFGFGVAAAGLGTFVLIVLMYVRLDIQSRRAKLSTRYGSEHNRCNTYLSPVKEARIVANKPRSSPETWGAFGILRSHTARTDACDSTQFDMDGGFGDESYNMISLETSTIPGSSRLGSRTCQSHLSSHDGIIREASTKPSIVLEFGPGFNPPLGRPEAKNQSEGEEESGEIDDDEFDDDFHGRENDDDDRDLERYDSTSIYSSSVAEFSNIDDQIFESDRRRRSRSVGAASTSQRRNRRSHRAHKFR